jgi:hypothetical protein
MPLRFPFRRRGTTSLAGADLRAADLRGADLSGESLRGADLRGARLAKADLSGADLSHADLSGAVLSGADLSGAMLYGARLVEANLSGADLRDAVLRGADLTGAHLAGARLAGAEIAETRLLSTTWGKGPADDGHDDAGADAPARGRGTLRPVVVLGAALALGAAAVLGVALPRMTGGDDPVPPDATAIVVPRTDATPVAQPVEAPATTTTTTTTSSATGTATTTTAAPATAPVALTLTGAGDQGSWVEAHRGDSVDGERLWRGLLAPGATMSWEVGDGLWLRLGDPEGVSGRVGILPVAFDGGTGNFAISDLGAVRLPD